MSSLIELSCYIQYFMKISKSTVKVVGSIQTWVNYFHYSALVTRQSAVLCNAKRLENRVECVGNSIQLLKKIYIYIYIYFSFTFSLTIRIIGFPLCIYSALFEI